MKKLDKQFWDNYFSLVKALALSCVPFLIALLFIGFDGLTFLIPTLGFAVIFCVIFSLITAFPLALMLPRTFVVSSFDKTLIIMLGLIIGAVFFHYNNAFYGTQRGCFRQATGIRPLFEIQVIRFDDYSWTDYTFNMAYKASSDFNRSVIRNGGYEHDGNRIDSMCFNKPNFIYVNRICFDSTFQFGAMVYSVD